MILLFFNKKNYYKYAIKHKKRFLLINGSQIYYNSWKTLKKKSFFFSNKYHEDINFIEYLIILNEYNLCGNNLSDIKNALNISYCYEPFYPNLFENIRKDDNYKTLTLKIILDLQKSLVVFFIMHFYKLLNFNKQKQLFLKNIVARKLRAWKYKLYILLFSYKPYKVLRGV